jgi:hypothetical protein
VSVTGVTGPEERCVVVASQPGDGAFDAAPPVTRAFRVLYPFTGFFQPVDNLPTVNTVKAGSAIPVKFSLGGNRGLDIFVTGSPGSALYTCGSDPTDAIEVTVAATSNSLSYDPTTSQYTFVWKTDKAWSSTCRHLVLKLKDGSSHTAEFKLTR